MTSSTAAEVCACGHDRVFHNDHRGAPTCCRVRGCHCLTYWGGTRAADVSGAGSSGEPLDTAIIRAAHRKTVVWANSKGESGGEQCARCHGAVWPCREVAWCDLVDALRAENARLRDDLTAHRCCSCVDNIADDRDEAEAEVVDLTAKLAAVVALCDRQDGFCVPAGLPSQLDVTEVRKALTGDDRD